MAFSKIRGRMAAQRGISAKDRVVAAIHFEAKKPDSGTMRFTVGHDVLAKMGLVQGDRVDIHEGTEDDLGSFMIERNPEGTHQFYATQGTTKAAKREYPYSQISISLNNFSHFTVKKAKRASVCTFQIFNKRLIIMTPPEWREEDAA